MDLYVGSPDAPLPTIPVQTLCISQSSPVFLAYFPIVFRLSVFALLTAANDNLPHHPPMVPSFAFFFFLSPLSCASIVTTKQKKKKL